MLFDDLPLREPMFFDPYRVVPADELVKRLRGELEDDASLCARLEYIGALQPHTNLVGKKLDELAANYGLRRRAANTTLAECLPPLRHTFTLMDRVP